MATTLEDYFLNNAPPAPFEPTPVYSREGDFVRYLFKNVEHYAVRVDDFLTVYRCIETKELVGCKCKGVLRILRKLNERGLGVLIQDKKIMVSLIFLALEADIPAERREELTEVSKAARDAKIELDKETLELVGAC